jgi:GT2 family glycosyltransferase
MEPVVVCIPTTPARKDRLNECLKTIELNAGWPCIIATYQNENEGFVAAIHKILGRLRPETLVWCIGDDARLVEEDTIKRLVGEFWSRFPDRDGVVNPDDGIQNGRIATLPLCTAKVMAENTSKEFFHNYADDVFTERMKHVGKYAYIPNVKVKHEHWTVGLAPKDSTYELAEKKYAEDAATYARMRDAGMILGNW